MPLPSSDASRPDPGPDRSGAPLVDAAESVGVVLGAGGVPGWAYHVGILAALESLAGWDARRADLLIGTSAGAGVASLLRAGLSADDQFALYQGRELTDAGQALHERAEAAVAAEASRPSLPDVPASQVPAFPVLGLRGLLNWPFRPGVVLAGALPRGRRDHHDLRLRLAAVHEEDWPQDPLWVTAVRSRDGRRVAFGRDAVRPRDVGEAVAASAAVPGWYEPVRIGRDDYLDGGTWSTTNADLAAGLGLDLVIVVAPMSSDSDRRSWEGAALRRAWHRSVLAKEVEAIRRHGSDVVVFEPSPADVRLMTTDETDEATRRRIAEAAHDAVVARLAADAELAATLAGAVSALDARTEGNDMNPRPAGPAPAPADANANESGTSVSAGDAPAANAPGASGRLVGSTFLAACRGETPDRRPVWFMRQAGRSLPEYRAIRGPGSILDAVKDPDLATEFTLQPVRRYGVDAAILYSDIMVPVGAIGFGVDIAPGIGPVVEHRFEGRADLDRLRDLDPEADTPYVQAAVRQLVAELDVPLIGFAGAPFTVASYLIEGRPSRDHARTKALMLGDPALFSELLDRLATLALTTLRAQVAAGCSAVQLFDSWAGALTPAHYRQHVLPHSRRVLEGVADLGVPRIHFGVGTGELLADMAGAGADVMGVDWRVPLSAARQRVGPARAVQGNLDPAVCLAPWDAVAGAARAVLAEGAGGPHIFNLGHGVLPETDPTILERLVDLVHRWAPSGRAPDSGA